MEGTAHHLGKLLAEEHALKMLKVKLETCRRIFPTNNRDDFIDMMRFVLFFFTVYNFNRWMFCCLQLTYLRSAFRFWRGGGLICAGGVYRADGERAEHSACQAST